MFFRSPETVSERRPRGAEMLGKVAHIDRSWRLVVAVFDGSSECSLLCRWQIIQATIRITP